MDHAALSRIGLRQLKSNPDPETEDRLASAHFLRWINQQDGKETSGQGRAGLTPQEMILNCAACHGNKDRHFGLFGQDCAQCHARPRNGPFPNSAIPRPLPWTAPNVTKPRRAIT